MTIPGRALGELLATLFERRADRDGDEVTEPLAGTCRALLSGRGEESGVKLATRLLARYREAGPEERLAFFSFLADGLDLDPGGVAEAARAYAENRDAGHLELLLEAAEPPRQELLRRLNQAPGGTADLVAMRADLIRAAGSDPTLARADLCFRHLFASWFNRGFLVLHRITWESPASILEKIIRYEAVHEIHSWADLRLRLKPPDRRLFAFFHPAMPDDPLIFVEIALTRGIPGAIGPILAQERTPLSAGDADTAVFYSISNCQDGLRGISFGNSLIKQVLGVLARDVPGVSRFVTLSPVPGLASWLAGQGEAGQALIGTAAPDPETLRRMVACYLLGARSSDGQPLDPVARFHLGNGAQLLDIHAGADDSARGMSQSRGAMVNYLYEPRRIGVNHEAYARTRAIMASRAVRTLAREIRGK